MAGQPFIDLAAENACRVLDALDGLERRLGVLARMQHCVVTRAQLLILGFPDSAIDRAVRNGRFRSLHRGVYLVTAIEPPLAAHVAAVLACGAGAVVSHRTAIELHGYLTSGRHPLDISVPSTRCPGARTGIKLHRVDPKSHGAFVRRNRLPVTAPIRSILDFATEAGRGELEQAVAAALRRGDARRDALVQAARTRPNRRGMPLLISVLTGPSRPAFTRSKAERILLGLIRAAKLPLPDANVPIGDRSRERYEADLLWREHGLIVEFDSVEHHLDEHSFHADRARDAYLLTLGYRVLRITWKQLLDEPEVVIARIAGALAVWPAAA